MKDFEISTETNIVGMCADASDASHEVEKMNASNVCSDGKNGLLTSGFCTGTCGLT